jgi:hypothetical protein
MTSKLILQRINQSYSDIPELVELFKLIENPKEYDCEYIKTFLLKYKKPWSITDPFNTNDKFFNDLLFKINEKRTQLLELQGTTSRGMEKQTYENEIIKIEQAYTTLCNCLGKKKCDLYVDNNQETQQQQKPDQTPSKLNKPLLKPQQKPNLYNEASENESLYQPPQQSTKFTRQNESLYKPPEESIKPIMNFARQKELIETIYKPTHDIIRGLLNTPKQRLESFHLVFETSIKENTTLRNYKQEEEERNETHFYKGFKLNNSNINELRNQQAALFMIDLTLKQNITSQYSEYNQFNNPQELLRKVSIIINNLLPYSLYDLEYVKQDITKRLQKMKNRNVRDFMDFELSTVKSVVEETKKRIMSDNEIEQLLNDKISNRDPSSLKSVSWVFKREDANKDINELNLMLEKFNYEKECIKELEEVEGRIVQELSCISLLGIIDLVAPYEGRQFLGGKRRKKRNTRKNRKKHTYKKRNMYRKRRTYKK